MAQLNITLNQEEILQLLSKDHDQAFRELLRKTSEKNRYRKIHNFLLVRTFCHHGIIIFQKSRPPIKFNNPHYIRAHEILMLFCSKGQKRLLDVCKNQIDYLCLP